MTGCFAVVTGGGTSGHVLPALAIADSLVVAGHPASSIHYVGTQRGVETSLVPPTGYPHTFLDVVGLQRSLSRRNLAFVPKLWRSVRDATALLRRIEPRVVVNVGGYGSFPATWAARRLGIPYVVVSYDRRPGLVSKLMAKRAAACAVAFPGSTLPHATLTGAPVRQEMIALERGAARAAARSELGLPADRFVVAVMCGSQGAAAVNDVVAGLVDRRSADTGLAVYHVVGDRFLGQAAPARDGREGILYRVIGYEHRMASLYAAADLLVTRGGAGTIAELATVGAPAVVVPWPGASENHQVDNAKVLSDVGAAVLVEQQHLTVDRLDDEVQRFRSEPVALAALARRAYEEGALHRSGELAALIAKVAAR
ncbi:MAG TPA: UDP-N-acetylglucosamine--N-acetylmuramyl-(pentapeptide) pyrophosphoryl-undecaprenol N-acetylglucosamine transferase [Acidimicrobiaceae bacterium]|nr:UDP-N-acetylglucosamine--N-acetylmuramyl-(pentapeptide) pyrophosphoryl-undecaprenol N-acetylglucosamine transferase [Acidimicrobiaceae bacterium]